MSLELLERHFLCDLDKCLGQCCIEGDAGAPITQEEKQKIEAILPEIIDDLTPAARREIEENGVSYIDEEGDLVTSLVDGAQCVFTCFMKPVSCHLYPVRITEYPTFKAVNLHRWDICKCAEVLGRKKGVIAYKFLKEPLTRRFGEEWYEELDNTAQEYYRQYGHNNEPS